MNLNVVIQCRYYEIFLHDADHNTQYRAIGLGIKILKNISAESKAR